MASKRRRLGFPEGGKKDEADEEGSDDREADVFLGKYGGESFIWFVVRPSLAEN